MTIITTPSSSLHHVTRYSLSKTTILLMVAGLILSVPSASDTLSPLVTTAISTATADEQAAAQVLDKLNQYSSSADWDKYFALYRQDGIFIGTDASERWGMAEFERYSRPTKGWSYDLTSRHLVQHGDVILFDELLYSPSYGVSRGTGTLIKTKGEWKIAQYHLSFPIPNGIAKKITTEIKNAQ